MKSTYVCLLFIFITISFGCRYSKTKFSQQELKWINVYKAGDTLIFKSTKGVLDTSFIIKSMSYYPKYMPIEVHDKYLPHSAVVVYKNKILEPRNEEDQLIYMIKKYPDKQLRVFINYLGSGLIISDLTTSEIDKYKSGKNYVFNTYNPKSKPYQPMQIIWHEDYGIIKYKLHNGDVWERINLSSK